MVRRVGNPFYPVLGIVGFLFTITAVSFCLAVLRGVRPETARGPRPALQRLMDRHGTAILAGELVVLAIATVGAVATDHVAVRREAAARAARRPRAGTGSP
jgi:hypothetical protein